MKKRQTIQRGFILVMVLCTVIGTYSSAYAAPPGFYVNGGRLYGYKDYKVDGVISIQVDGETIFQDIEIRDGYSKDRSVSDTNFRCEGINGEFILSFYPLSQGAFELYFDCMGIHRSFNYCLFSIYQPISSTAHSIDICHRHIMLCSA